MTIRRTLYVFLVLCICSSFAVADSFTNGGFETGDFTGWLTTGDALVVNSTLGVTPIGGTYQALISDAPSHGFDGNPNPGYPFQANGTYSGSPSIPGEGPNSVESFLGLPLGSLFAMCGQPCGALEGSAIRQSFTGNFGDMLSFTFDYLTNDGGLDYAFVALDGTVNLVVRGTSPTCTSYPTPVPGRGSPSSPTRFSADCGYQLFDTTLTTSGTHYVGIGVVDTFDPTVNSAILVGNFALTPAPIPTPEPGTLLLFGSGLVGLVALRKKRTRSQWL